MLCRELGQMLKEAARQEAAETCSISDEEEPGESWDMGQLEEKKGVSGKWFSTLDLYWSEPRLGGLRDCPHVGSVPVMLTMAGTAACISLLLQEP